MSDKFRVSFEIESFERLMSLIKLLQQFFITGVTVIEPGDKAGNEFSPKNITPHKVYLSSRICENPNCKNEFHPKTVRSKFCSAKCANAMRWVKKSLHGYNDASGIDEEETREETDARVNFTVEPDGRKRVEVGGGNEILIRANMDPDYAASLYAIFHLL